MSKIQVGAFIAKEIRKVNKDESIEVFTDYIPETTNKNVSDSHSLVLVEGFELKKKSTYTDKNPAQEIVVHITFITRRKGKGMDLYKKTIDRLEEFGMYVDEMGQRVDIDDKKKGSGLSTTMVTLKSNYFNRIDYLKK